MKISPALLVFPLIVAAATESVTAKSPIKNHRVVGKVFSRTQHGSTQNSKHGGIEKPEAARLARAEEAARAFVLANSGLVEGTANFDAAVAAARELARTF